MITGPHTGPGGGISCSFLDFLCFYRRVCGGVCVSLIVLRDIDGRCLSAGCDLCLFSALAGPIKKTTLGPRKNLVVDLTALTTLINPVSGTLSNYSPRIFRRAVLTDNEDK